MQTTLDRKQIDSCSGKGEGLEGQEGRSIKGQEEILRGDAYVPYLDCGDSCTHTKSYQVEHFECVQFIVRQLYHDKAGKAVEVIISATKLNFLSMISPN